MPKRKKRSAYIGWKLNNKQKFIVKRILAF